MVRVGLVERDVVADAKELPLAVVEEPEVHPVHLGLCARREAEQIVVQRRGEGPGVAQSFADSLRRRLLVRRELTGVASLGLPAIELR